MPKPQKLILASCHDCGIAVPADLPANHLKTGQVGMLKVNCCPNCGKQVQRLVLKNKAQPMQQAPAVPDAQQPQQSAEAPRAPRRRKSLAKGIQQTSAVIAKQVKADAAT
jgi:predicted  nucleic acid-binding Zn-ribbon protein